MAASDPLDIDALLAPIPGDHPAGGSVPFMVRQKLEDYRKEIDPADFDKNDPARPDKFQKADWAAIISLSSQTLTETSKDLLIAARLTEALTKEKGFPGLQEGLILLRRLVSECWDRINPAILSDDDLEKRAAAFQWLDDTDRGARFPNALRQLALISSDAGRFTWYQWKEQGTKGGDNAGEIEKVIATSEVEDCRGVVTALTACSEELKKLDEAASEKMGEFAPSFSGLRQAIEECRTLAIQILQRKGGTTTETTAIASEPSALAATSTPVAPTGALASSSFVASQVQSRDQIYKQLSEAARMLEKLEPHSPIPYLLNRAVELGALSFPELMRQLIQDADALTAMNRQLGIKPKSD